MEELEKINNCPLCGGEVLIKDSEVYPGKIGSIRCILPNSESIHNTHYIKYREVHWTYHGYIESMIVGRYEIKNSYYPKYRGGANRYYSIIYRLGSEPRSKRALLKAPIIVPQSEEKLLKKIETILNFA